MDFIHKFTIDNGLTFISLIFGLIGGIFIYYQWKKSINNKRAEFIYQILEKLRFDANLSNTMYKIEYNNHWYDNSFHNSKLEKEIDVLFAYIDYICYLNITGNISNKEFNIFKYEIHRVCNSPSTKKYLYNLFQFSKKNNSVSSFQHLIDYAIKSNLFESNFKINKNLYPKTLNW